MPEDSKISRVARSKREAQATYDEIAGLYDLLEGFWERRQRSSGLQKLAVREGETILEIGFGTGHALLALARSVGKTGRVWGLEVSPRMMEIARERIAEEGLLERAEPILGDAARLPFAAESFDAVFISFVLELFDTPEIPLVLRECERVLRRDGRICVVSLSREGGPSRMRDLYEWGHGTFPRLLDCRPILVRRALEAAGFRIVDASLTTLWGIPVEIVVARKEDRIDI